MNEAPWDVETVRVAWMGTVEAINTDLKFYLTTEECSSKCYQEALRKWGVVAGVAGVVHTCNILLTVMENIGVEVVDVLFEDMDDEYSLYCLTALRLASYDDTVALMKHVVTNTPELATLFIHGARHLCVALMESVSDEDMARMTAMWN